MDIGGRVCCIVCLKGGVWGIVCSIFRVWMNFGSCGGNGGLVMTDGPKITGIVCVCSVVSVCGLVKGESVWVLIVQMCCLLCLFLQPWASMMYVLGLTYHSTYYV